jgi:aminoglycoside phosphotransferase (APT) family kinase protein
MCAQFDRHLATCAAHGEVGRPAGRDPGSRRRRPAGVVHRGSLVPQRLHEGNVLVAQSRGVTGFIDVENMIAADPMLDLAKTLQYDRDRSPAKRAALLEGYGPLPSILEDIRELV